MGIKEDFLSYTKWGATKFTDYFSMPFKNVSRTDGLWKHLQEMRQKMYDAIAGLVDGKVDKIKHENSMTTLNPPSPLNAQRSFSSSQTGQIRIDLPTKENSIFFKFKVNITEFNDDSFGSLIIEGFNRIGGFGSTTSAINSCKATPISKNSKLANKKVYFCTGVTKDYILIGEPSDTLSIRSISITEVSTFSQSDWSVGWGISITTTLENLDSTKKIAVKPSLNADTIEGKPYTSFSQNKFNYSMNVNQSNLIKIDLQFLKTYGNEKSSFNINVGFRSGALIFFDITQKFKIGFFSAKFYYKIEGTVCSLYFKNLDVHAGGFSYGGTVKTSRTYISLDLLDTGSPDTTNYTEISYTLKKYLNDFDTISGIKFPSTQVASTDPNTLDDYEEGTWTPTIEGTITNPSGITYSVQTGWYTKIGRLVTCTLNLSGTFTSKGTGGLKIGGLPFNPSNVISGHNYCGLFAYLPLNVKAYVQQGVNKIGFEYETAGSGISGIDWSNASVSGNNFRIGLQFSYMID